MNKKKDFLGLSRIAVALIFLFNPNLHLIDPLPDFIGYLFLSMAFSKLADLNEEIESAVALFRKMIWVDAAKYLALFLSFSMASSGERNSSLLLWTFVFATAELIVLIPAYLKLFGGITKLGYFFPNTAIVGSVKKGKNSTDRAKRATMIFICIKSLFTILPEFADLSNNAYHEESGFINIYRYIGLLRGLGIVIVLIFGTFWLCQMQRYFYQLRRDKILISALSDTYQKEVQPKVGVFTLRKFQLSYFVFLLGLIFSMDFRLDEVTLFPDFFSALAMMGVLFILSGIISFRKTGGIIASAIYLIFSLISYGLEQRFFLQYSYSAMIKNDTAFFLYTALVICNLLKVLSFLVTLYFIYRAFCKIILVHTGTMIGKEYVDERVKAMELSLHHELKKPLFVAMLSALLYGVSDICYDVFAPMFSGIYVKGEAVFGTFSNIQDHYGWIKTINLLLLIVCVTLFVRSLTSIVSAIQNKYMLE